MISIPILLSSRGAGGPEGSAPVGNLKGRFLVAALLGMTEGVSRLALERDQPAVRPSDAGLPTTDYRLPTSPSHRRLTTVDCQLPP